MMKIRLTTDTVNPPDGWIDGPNAEKKICGDSPPQPISYALLSTTSTREHDSFIIVYQKLGSLLRWRRESLISCLFMPLAYKPAIVRDDSLN